ncbi:MAG: polymer-forming cytoskeletal protein [Bacteroidales bacterium]
MAAINQETTVSSHNSFAQGTEIIGEIKSGGDIRIDGKLKGNINIKGRLVIGTTGVVEGEIFCANCDVAGKIVGKVNVSELFSLKASANVEGEVITKKLAIEPGAIFTVTCKMNDEKSVQSGGQPQEKKDKIEPK